MKRFLLIVSLVVTVWGAWIVTTDQGDKQATIGAAACESVFPNQPAEVTKCSGRAYGEGDSTQMRGLWALVLGGAASLILWLSVRNESRVNPSRSA